MRLGPIGAQCAIHVGVTAPYVCERCGNFMCLSCTDGTTGLCPTCRSLQGAAGFPFDASMSLNDLWNHVWKLFQADWLMLTLAGVVFLAMTAAGGLVSNIITTLISAILGVKVDTANPMANLGLFAGNMVVGQIVNTMVNMPVQGVALVGLYRVLMDSLLGRRADLSRMFSQLHLLPKYLVLQLMLFGAVTVPMLVVGGGIGLLAFRMSNMTLERSSITMLSAAAVLLVFAAVVVIIAVSLVAIPVVLFTVPELMVGDCTPVEAVKRAWALGDGQRLRIIGYSLVSGAIVMAGVMACCIGFLPALPLSYLIVLGLFLALRQGSSLPPAVHR